MHADVDRRCNSQTRRRRSWTNRPHRARTSSDELSFDRREARSEQIPAVRAHKQIVIEADDVADERIRGFTRQEFHFGSNPDNRAADSLERATALGRILLERDRAGPTERSWRDDIDNAQAGVRSPREIRRTQQSRLRGRLRIDIDEDAPESNHRHLHREHRTRSCTIGD
jgi:hypothetical protein